MAQEQTAFLAACRLQLGHYGRPLDPAARRNGHLYRAAAVRLVHEPTGKRGFVQSPEVVLTGGGVPTICVSTRITATRYSTNPAIFPNPPKAGETPSGSNFAKVDENFKLPQLWRTSVAADFRLPWEMVLTLEAMYSKDINAVTQRNINLPDPVGNFTGVDDRPRWNSGKLNKDVSSMMVLTNTNKGHQASLTVQLTKQFSNGLSGMIAYTYNNAKDLTANPGSVALSA